MWLLDTNICIYLIKKKPPRVLDRLRMLDVSDVAISSITLAELEFGVAKSGRPEENANALAAFIAPLEILPFDEVAASCYGPIRADLERRGTPIGSLDLLIAAHALSHDCTLVTNNEQEFSRIHGLRIENWS
jgi:tRNA(fMet)-specific endonuclease VapC